MSSTTSNGRELTLKETNTASLLSRLSEIYANYAEDVPTVLSIEERVEIEAIERELEERAEWEQKASRW